MSKKSIAERAVEACVEYEKFSQEEAFLTKKIAQGFDSCAHKITNSDTERETTCLTRAFSLGNGGDDTDSLLIFSRITECEGCKSAFKAIRDRKKARLALGVAKRKIRQIGKGEKK